MAHEIEGNKAFFVGSGAWHGLGKVLTDAPNCEEAWKIAYPHTLFKLPVEAILKTDDGAEHRTPCKTHQAVFRDDGKELGFVGTDYELLQPWEVFKHFEPLMEQGLVKLEAGGSLRDGRQMWALGKVQGCETEVLPGDPIRGYLLMSTGFEGSMRVYGGLKNTRVVCANTLSAAIDEDRIETDIRVKHTKNMRNRITDCMELIGHTINSFKGITAAYRHLAKKDTTRAAQEQMIVDTFLTKKEQSKPDEISTKKANVVKQVIDLLDTQKGLELVPQIRGTAWQAYNAVTEYTTHHYGRTEESRLHAQWFGESAKIADKAFNLALAM